MPRMRRSPEEVVGKLWPDELLSRETFRSLREAQILLEAWRKHTNALHPHFAFRWTPGQRSGSPRPNSGPP